MFSTLGDVAQFLSTEKIECLLATHPNQAGDEQRIWQLFDWWEWAGQPERWKTLIRYHDRCGLADTVDDKSDDIPGALRDIIQTLSTLEIDRTPIRLTSPQASISDTRGMTPKKIHEVTRMTTVVAELLDLCHNHGHNEIRIVDVGSGQGYLTRSLATLPLCHSLLALDSNCLQTHGAESWSTKMSRRHAKDGNTSFIDKISHQTLFLEPDSLLEAVDTWLGATSTDPENRIPVVFVSLHSCGSLTPTIFRSIIQEQTASISSRKWHTVGAVVVGCCYNLLDPKDYPVSEKMQGMSGIPTAHTLPLGHVHLAAQVPHTWLKSPKSTALNTHIVRKVAFRALLNHIMGLSNLPPPDTRQAEGTGITEMHLRLGKLPEAVYDDFGLFIRAASAKLGQDLTTPLMQTFGPEPTKSVNLAKMLHQMEVLHTLRCLLGPLIETLIIRDRLQMMQESLTKGSDLQGECAALFDQDLGSGRNIAIIIRPRTDPVVQAPTT